MSDAGWLRVHEELAPLHERKSATYGNDDEAFFNFVEIGRAQERVPERYVWERILEKSIRSLNMIDAGLADSVKEGPDVASLGIVAEALRRRRL